MYTGIWSRFIWNQMIFLCYFSFFEDYIMSKDKTVFWTSLKYRFQFTSQRKISGTITTMPLGTAHTFRVNYLSHGKMGEVGGGRFVQFLLNQAKYTGIKDPFTSLRPNI